MDAANYAVCRVGAFDVAQWGYENLNPPTKRQMHLADDLIYELRIAGIKVR